MVGNRVIENVNRVVRSWQLLGTSCEEMRLALTANATYAASAGIATAWRDAAIDPALGQVATLQAIPLTPSPLGPLLTTARNALIATRAVMVGIRAAAVDAPPPPPPLPPPPYIPYWQATSDTRMVAGATLIAARLGDLEREIDGAIQFIEECQTNNGARGNLGLIRENTGDISTYPILTQEMGYSPPVAWSGGSGGAGGGGAATPLVQVVQRTVSEILGRRPRLSDPSAFVSALSQSFETKEVDGRAVYSLLPRTYVGQTELGAMLTGAQASIYQRAKVVLDNVLPLIDKLEPMRPDYDQQEIDAAHAIVRSELPSLVSEFGLEGGPRVSRVDDLFYALIDPNQYADGTARVQQGFELLDYPGQNITQPPHLTGLYMEYGSGDIGRMGDIYGLNRQRANTVEEERNLTDFVILRDYVTSLFTSWQAYRPSFLGQTDNYLGTQLVLLARTLSVVGESVDEARFAMSSVFLGPNEQQTQRIEFADGSPPIYLADLLRWVETVATSEGPQLIKEGGKHGARNLVPLANRLATLVRGTIGSIAHPAGNHPRVRRTLEELAGQLDRVRDLAGTVR